MRTACASPYLPGEYEDVLEDEEGDGMQPAVVSSSSQQAGWGNAGMSSLREQQPQETPVASPSKKRGVLAGLFSRN